MKQILWTALVTPFNNDNSIDYVSLQKCLHLQEFYGNGIVLFGSTGEGLSLTEEEKRKILIFVCNLQLKTKIIVCVPSYNLFIAEEWLKFCNDYPIDGYLMTIAKFIILS